MAAAKGGIIIKPCAGIVLYQPDLDRLKQNLDAVHPQVERVYCFNNGVADEQSLLDLMAVYPRVLILGNGENLGIATALERIMRRADDDGYDWVLTLDQDSVVPAGMIIAFEPHTHDPSVGIVCPTMVDRRRTAVEATPQLMGVSEVSFCITSGAFTSVDAWKAIGGFDEKLFIGLVDNEYCFRLCQAGYRIIQVNAVVLDHELGRLTPSPHADFFLKLGSMLHCSAIKKLSYQREVSPMRLYYSIRNILYLQRKHAPLACADWSRRMLLQEIVSNLLRGRRRLTLCKAIIKGWRDGLREPIPNVSSERS